jgi:hypothetical protein
MRLPRYALEFRFPHTVSFLIIGTAVLLLAFAPVVANAATPQLVCTPARLGFGAIVVGHSETFLVTLANTGQSSVTVSGINVSNSEFTTSQLTLPLVLAARESVDLSVVFTPTMGWTGGSIEFSTARALLVHTLNPVYPPLKWSRIELSRSVSYAQSRGDWLLK